MLRRSIISVLLPAFFALCASAQSKVQADVEIKTLQDGKVVTVTKRVFCQGNGRVVTVFSSPVEYYTVSNLKGEFKLYVPSKNEVTLEYGPDYSTKGELLYLFLAGRSSDLGLAGYGYVLQGSEYDKDGYLVRTYTTKSAGAPPKVELVLNDYLPVYVAYYTQGGKIASKSYLSQYSQSGGFVFPARYTNISYTEKGDSTIVRTIYSNVGTDGSSPMFDFEVPSGAKAVKNPLLDAQGKKK